MGKKRTVKQYHMDWQHRCEQWLSSMSRNKQLGDVTYDYDSACLTLVPKTHYYIDSGEQQDLIRDIQPLCEVMDSALIEYDIHLDAVYHSQSQCTIVRRVMVQFTEPEAVTDLFLRVEREHLCLKGGLRTTTYG